LNVLFCHATAPDLLQAGEFPENLFTFLSNSGCVSREATCRALQRRLDFMKAISIR
jgi:hypothetical protein